MHILCIYYIFLVKINECYNLDGQQFTRDNPNSNKYTQHFIVCNNNIGSSLKFNGTKFLNLQTNDQSGTDLVRIINVKSIIMNCPITNCNYAESLFYFDGINYDFTLTGNQIITSPGNSLSANTIYSKAKYSYIEGNNINYADTTHSCRAFYIEYSTDTIFINNYIINSNNGNIGSGIYSPSVKTGKPLEIRGCMFSGCKGGNGAIFYLDNLDHDVTLTNITFEKTYNENNPSDNPNSGYLISINTKHCNPQLTFYGCTFKLLETNALGGGSIGLWFRGKSCNEHNISLLFENTKFESLNFLCTDVVGGAIVLSGSVSNKNAYLTVRNCSFNNVSSNKGGAAISYGAAKQQLIVESTVFSNVFSKQSGNGGAIYILYESQTLPAIIRDCIFNDVKLNSGNGNAIYTISNSNKKLTIENCKFNGCGSSGFVVYSQNSELLIDSSKFYFQGTITQSSGGVYINKKGKFSFHEVTFENVKSTPVSFQKEDNQNKIYEIEFLDCSFTKCASTSSSLIVLPEDYGEYLIFNRCTFISSYSSNYIINTKGFKSINVVNSTFTFTATESKKCGGIKITCFNNNYDVTITIDTCIFSYTQISEAGGALSTEIFQNLLVQKCSFTKCSASGSGINGGAIYINNQVPSTSSVAPKALINDCLFIQNSAVSGHGICMTGSNSIFEITNCIFTDNSNDKYVIVVNQVQESHFENSIFNFTQETNACGAIIFNNIGNHFISNSLFEKTSSIGSIYYDIGSGGSDFEISIESCVFNKFTGTNTPAFSIKCPHVISFHNNTISNRNGNYIGLISNTIDCSVNSVTLSSCKFINLTNALNDQLLDTNCGGCGLWIVIDKTVKYSITFDRCYFENNRAPKGNGGAIDYGSGTQSLKSNELHFLNCIFMKNSASKNGGAISIATIYQATIKNCTFIENSAVKGGAIYINPNPYTHQADPSTISNCSFYSNSASSNGHAVYLEARSQDTQHHKVDNCIFENNFKESSLETEGIIILNDCKVDMSYLNFLFDESAKNLQPIVYLNKPLHALDLVFESLNSENDKLFVFDNTFQSISFENCQFLNCYTANSFIISSTTNTFSFSYSTIQYSEEKDKKQKGGISCSCSGTSSFSIRNSNFINVDAFNLEISCTSTIQYCTFDNSCFNISKLKDITFNDNIITNNANLNRYSCKFDFNNDFNFVINNVSFIKNQCNCLYGGGVGFYIKGISSLSFYDSKFSNNKAVQNTLISRPSQYDDIPYYNGDGGGIQLGYSCDMNDMDVTFERCEFKNNEAYRHGGALAIQTLKSVKINDCTFENNFVSNYLSSTLLYNNNFHKKTEGRGGAIYINPSYHFESLGCSSVTNHEMSNVIISQCTFNSNKAFDGYAIYIEGETEITTFQITQNTFTNNFDKDTLYKNSSIIASEVCSFSEKDVIDNNIFVNNENGNPITVNYISCVDYRGKQIPSKEFSQTHDFSNSKLFTNSKYFTKSGLFSKTITFSYSNSFTKSNDFSRSSIFSQSSDFTNSEQFSKSKAFSGSFYFSKSDLFSKSELFTNSKEFTRSFFFTKSNEFSNSNGFSKTKEFEKTNQFTQTKDFTNSIDFSNSFYFTSSKAFSCSKGFQNSDEFSNSKEFSYSNSFSESDSFSSSKGFTNSFYFSNSNEFTNSLEFSYSNKFTNSFYFSNSNDFTDSNVFSNSKSFSNSKGFTDSKVFSNTKEFTKSNEFSNSNIFSQTNGFSNSNKFSETFYFSKSNDFSDSKIFSKSKEFTDSNVFSNTKEFTKSSEFSNSNIFSQTNGFSNSNKFSETFYFSKSNDFSNSYKFTSSNLFSNSNEFTKTDHFSETFYFSTTNDFTRSEIFSKTNDFSESNSFSNSFYFSNSDKFSQSESYTNSLHFSNSKIFSKTNDFTNSNYFSISNHFNDSAHFSRSNEFTFTFEFTKTDHFSETNCFSKTNDFTISKLFSNSNSFSNSFYFSNSNEFSQSEIYTNSIYFSDSNVFSQSESYTNSLHFSSSKQFSATNDFSNTNYFSISNHFSESTHFSNSNKFTKTDYFSLTNDFTISRKFSDSIQFTNSNQFNNTQIFSESKEFSHTGKFSKSLKFSHSSYFSHTNHFSMTQDFTKTGHFSRTSHFSETSQFSSSNGFSGSSEFSFSEGFSDSEQFTLSASLIPSEPSCTIIDEYGNTTLSDRCNYSEFEGKKVTVQIVRDNFTDYLDENDGAAIHIRNCGLYGNNTKFINCVSNKGSGGGIYIKNTLEIENNITLENLLFIECKALYGGAVYIYSSYENSFVFVKNCTFQRNKSFNKKNNQNNLYGGSSAFFTVRNLNILDCAFEKSIGAGGAVKVFNVFDEDLNDAVKILEEYENSIAISGCKFDNEKGSTNSIYIFSNKPGNDVDINECKFIGKLIKGSHYIDGKLIKKDSGRIRIDSCKFEHESTESIKIDLANDAFDASVNIVRESNYQNGKSISFYLLLHIIAFSILLSRLKKTGNKINNNDDSLLSINDLN